MKTEGRFRSRRQGGEIDVAYGVAMQRAVERHAKHVKWQGKKWLRFNAWWRDGKELNASLDVEAGFITDWTNNEKIGAVKLAEMLGQDFKDFMSGIPATFREPTPRPPERTGVAALWERLLEVERRVGRATAPASRWLRTVRGFPDDVDVTLDSGYVTVGRPSVDAFEGGLRRWIGELVETQGIHIAAPLRDAMTGEIRTLQFRPIGLASATGRRLWLPGTSLQAHDNDAPRGYGFAQLARSAGVVVFVEGFADNAAAELFCRGDKGVVSVGAGSASTIGHWTSIFSCARGEILLVPQLDRPVPDCRACSTPVPSSSRACPSCGVTHNPGEQSQRAMATVATSLRRLDRPCKIFDWDGFLDGLGVDDDGYVVKDLANAVRLAGFSRARESFMRAARLG